MKRIQTKRHFSCYIIGEDSLVIQCATLLLQHGHKLKGIISANSLVKEWTTENKISLLDSNLPFEPTLLNTKFDYLFSITNYKILSKTLLQHPQKLAINYHDALLPQYAGMHATSWAILNNEKQHGITWHIMTNVVDAGDILKQATVSINSTETALTLNLKCYQAAISTFSELIKELANKSFIQTSQNLQQRTYFAFNKKPVGNGWINWNSSANDIYTMYRALSLGNYTNRLSTLKFIIDKQEYIADKIKVLSTSSHQQPGTIVSKQRNNLQVTTQSTDILITKIKKLDGTAVQINALPKSNKLTTPTKKTLQNYSLFCEDIFKHENFWVKAFLQFKPATLPFLNSHLPKATNFKPILINKIKLPEKLIKQLATKFGKRTAISHIVLTACLIYLYRIGNQATLGVALSNTVLQQHKKQMPFIAEQIPFTVTFTDAMTFAQALLITTEQLNTHKKQETYLADLPTRYAALSNISQAFINIHLDKYSPTLSNPCPITLTFDSANQSMQLYAKQDALNTNLNFFLKNIFGHLLTLLQAIVTQPQQIISTLPLLTTAEQQEIVLKWNKTAAPYPHNKTVHQLFEEQVEKTPNNIAVTFDNEKLTYKELNQKSNQLAHYLREQGVKIETLVAICVERSLEMIISILGILKAGGAYVPIDTDYPEQRIQHILQDTQIKFILTQSKHIKKLQHSNIEKINLDTHQKAIIKKSINNPKIKINAKNLIYILYTSGSTGNPKGVSIEHLSVVNFLYAILQQIPINQHDKFLGNTAITFDIFGLEIYLPLIIGAQCILSNNLTRTDGYLLKELILQEKITLLQATPSTIRLLLEAGWTNKKSLKILCGGEPISQTIINALLKHTPFFWNLYGPTETTIWSTIHKFTKLNPLPLIGKPLQNTQVYVADHHQAILPIGVSGELHIGGAGVARNYINQKNLTSKKFITNSFDTRQNSRLYKTGDIVRWLPDGTLEYLKRVDDQIKFHGFRIEPAEIEHSLQKHPAISQAAVLLSKKNQKEQLVAFIKYKSATSKQKALDNISLQNYLRKFFPAYMIPNHFVEIETFPLTPNGKVNRTALAEIDWSTTSTHKTLKNPTTKLEQQLLSIWQKIFENPNISTDDDFFALGGDSIVAIQIISQAKKQEIELAAAEIFTQLTIKKIASCLSKAQPHTTSSKINTAFKILNQAPNSYTLSPLQKGLLFHAIYTPNSEAYIIQLLWDPIKNLNIKILCQALELLANRHELLRSVFIWEGLAEPTQNIQPQIKLPFELHDWTNLPAYKQKEQLNNFLHEDRRLGFNFEEAPLLRLTAILLANNYYQIILTSHHILLDGWSLMILLNELEIIYNSISKTESTQLATIPPYINYILWLKNQDLTSAEKFWRNYLQDFHTPTNPNIFKNHSLSSNIPIHYAAEIFELTSYETKQLKFFSQQHKLTLNTVIQGVWALLLSRYSQNNDIVFGNVFTERNIAIPGIEHIVGPLINTLPLRIILKNTASVIEYLKDIQLNSLQVTQFHYTPLTHIQAWSKTSSTLFNTIIAFENYPSANKNNKLFKQSKIHIIDPTHYPLTLSITAKEQIVFKFGYNKNSIKKSSIKQLKEHLKVLLSQFINTPTSLISKLNILTDIEKKHLFTDWNKPYKNPKNKKSLAQYFEEQVKKHPNATAVSFTEQSLTYAELNSVANQLAHYLKQQNITVKTHIAVIIERNIDMIIALLAIIKLGATYIPIDPEHPDERIFCILKDSKPVLVLSHSTLKNRFNEKNSNLKFFYLDKNIDLINTQSEKNLQLTITPNSPMYAIYTSGSTGKPKGVVLTQNTIINLIAWQKTVESFTVQNVTQFANSNFDVSVQEIFYALLNGFHLHIVPTSVKKSVADLIHFVEEKKINQLFLPTAYLDIFCSEATHQQASLKALNHIFVAGEALKISPAIHQFFKTYFNVRLHNQYGPSETHVVTSFTLPQDVEQWPNLSCIGKPISNTNIYVLDQNGIPVPPGIPGELHIAGISLALGYLNQAEMTQQKFIANPFSKTINSCLYKTGDLACWLPDGNLKYLGRIDDRQIKIRGFRVELDEIEIYLKSYYQIAQAIVLPLENRNKTKTLIAYLVAQKNQTIDLDQLHTYLKKFLPKYMLPSQFLVVEKFPLTANGKIDKQALLSKTISQKILYKNNHVAPRLPTEKLLATIWSSVLNIKKISIYDNFFDLGGHSINALQIASQIKRKFSTELTLRTLFHAQTIAELTPIIDSLKQTSTQFNGITMPIIENSNCLIALKPNGKKTPLFLIHPVGGTVFWYMSLTKYLDHEQPVYAIQDPGLENSNIPFQSVEEMAHFYLQIIRKIQTSGPYLLGGASAGATTSIEMARQLKADGEEVAFIALLDGWVPYPEGPRNQEIFETNMRRQYHAMQTKFIANGITSADTLLKLQWQRAQQNASYKVPVMNQKLTLFKAMENTSIYKTIEHPLNYWNYYSTYPVELHQIPGNHETIFDEPNVVFLAKKLTDCLEKIIPITKLTQ